MRSCLTLLFVFVISVAIGQQSQTIDLRWKIDNNDTLTYGTVMKDIEPSSVEMDFGGLLRSLSDSTSKGIDNSKPLFRELNERIRNLDYVTTLTANEEGVVDILMSAQPTSTTDETDSKAGKTAKGSKSIGQGVVLRGSVYESGGVHSFWLKSQQKNMVALLFELPAGPVKVGDKWPLDVSLISNDQNFACDSAYRVNEVTLTEIKEVEGETVAVLKYNVVEYVDGDFILPYGGQGPKDPPCSCFRVRGSLSFLSIKGVGSLMMHS
ncbi:hypothetical protein AB9P05_04930 [Roseivirga sp. BDSF3-8]|uniref:hypothetical protein n=1 Tax=Roseivirga sp. BDSF3-8 TaxID=3241598 RepID=UPI0035323137